MEVVGGIAAVAQLCSVVVKYIGSAAGASDARRQLQNYILDCQTLLEKLEQKPDDTEKEKDWTETIQLLNEPGSPLARLGLTLGRINAKLESINQSLLGKTWAKLKWPFDEPQVEKLVKAIGSDMQLLQVALASDAQKLMEDIRTSQADNNRAMADLANAFEGHSLKTHTQLTEVKAGLEHIHDVHADVRDIMDAEGRNKILQWLNPTDYGPEHSDFASRQQPGTGGWLLESTEFKTWKENAGQTLFCPGIPGAGKTILTSIVADNVMSEFSAHPDVAIAYIYCSYRRRDQQDLQHLLSSLVKQLAIRQTHLPALKALYDAHSDRNTRPSIYELTQVLSSVASLSSRVFILIDALDESSQTYGGSRFLQAIFSLREDQKANVFATSRAIPDIVAQFRDHPTVEICASQEDVKAYLEGYFHDSGRRLPAVMRKNKALQDEIRDTIAQAVQGMFLLAHLYIRSLENKITARDIKMALKDFSQQGPQPANANSCLTGDHKKQALKHAYKRVMERIVEQEPDTRKLAIGALPWLIHAHQPLRKQELQHALGAGLAIDYGEPKLDEDILPDIEEIISACAGMVTVDESTGEVRLIHYTTFDYLWDTQEQWFPRMDALQRIVRTCLFYMSQYYNPDEAVDAPPLHWRRAYPFGWYAQYNWGVYARHLPFCEEVIDFLLDDKRVKFHDPFEHCPDHNGLQFACKWGIHYAIPRLLEHNPHSYLVKDEAGRTPLMVAVGGPVGVRCDDRTELANELRSLHETTVRLLYEGSTINYPITPSHTAEALRYAIGNENMFKLLVRLGHLDLNFRGKSGRSLLSFAVEGGDDNIVKLLLDSGQVEVDLQDDMGRTPLSYAPDNQGKRIVEMLLDAGANANLKDNGGRVPLINAAVDLYGCEDGLISLLAATKEEELNSKDPGGHTVLSHAVAKGLEVLVGLLVDMESVNPNTTDELGRSPLFYGAMGKIEHEGVVSTLLQREGIDVNQRDFTGSTPLSAAARLGHVEAVSLLLNRPDIVLDAEDIFGRTALSWAVAKGQGEILKLLLDKHAEQGQNIIESDLQTDTDTDTDRKPKTLTPTNSLLCFVCLVARVDLGKILSCKQCCATINWRKNYLTRHPCKRCFDIGKSCRSGGPREEYLDAILRSHRPTREK